MCARFPFLSLVIHANRKNLCFILHEVGDTIKILWIWQKIFMDRSKGSQHLQQQMKLLEATTHWKNYILEKGTDTAFTSVQLFSIEHGRPKTQQDKSRLNSMVCESKLIISALKMFSQGAAGYSLVIFSNHDISSIQGHNASLLFKIQLQSVGAK